MGAGCLAKLPLPWGLVSGPRDKLLSQGKVWVRRVNLPATLCSSGRAWNPLQPHLPEFRWVPCISFGPLAVVEGRECVVKKDLEYHSSFGFADPTCFGARFHRPRAPVGTFVKVMYRGLLSGERECRASNRTGEEI